MRLLGRGVSWSQMGCLGKSPLAVLEKPARLKAARPVLGCCRKEPDAGTQPEEGADSPGILEQNQQDLLRDDRLGRMRGRRQAVSPVPGRALWGPWERKPGKEQQEGGRKPSVGLGYTEPGSVQEMEVVEGDKNYPKENKQKLFIQSLR